MSLKETLTSIPQYILPHHPLSRTMGLLTHSKNRIWKNFFIQQIVSHYHVDMDEAIHSNIDAYTCFNDFFTRELKPGIRPIASAANSIVSPADGTVSQAGNITNGDIIQAKGKTYTVKQLLRCSQQRADFFNAGKFTTIYLSPKDYHRLHMPVDGVLTKMVHIPGRLFSVNAATANSVPRLFARNERVVCHFDTQTGPMALVLVGAIFVASIETVWHGVVTPPTEKNIQSWNYSKNAPNLSRGVEMGRFNMGSTIIVLFGKDNKMNWIDKMQAGLSVKLGQAIGSC